MQTSSLCLHGICYLSYAVQPNLMHWSACTHCAARHKILMPWGTGLCLAEHWYAVANIYMHWDSEHMPCEIIYMPCRTYALQLICRARHGALKICIAGRLSAWHLHKYQCVSTRHIVKADHIPVDTKMIEHTPCTNLDMPCRTYALQIICRAAHVFVLDLLISVIVYAHGISTRYICMT